MNMKGTQKGTEEIIYIYNLRASHMCAENL